MEELFRRWNPGSLENLDMEKTRRHWTEIEKRFEQWLAMNDCFRDWFSGVQRKDVVCIVPRKSRTSTTVAEHLRDWNDDDRTHTLVICSPIYDLPKYEEVLTGVPKPVFRSSTEKTSISHLLSIPFSEPTHIKYVIGDVGGTISLCRRQVNPVPTDRTTTSKVGQMFDLELDESESSLMEDVD